MPAARSTRQNTTKRPAPRTPSAVQDGKRIRLTDLPLVAYALNCGCLGRGYAVVRNDLLFCEKHAKTAKVSKILA